MSIGTVITHHRKCLGLTQEALAQKLGLSNQAVSKWESEQSLPDILLLPRLADLFGITVDALFERDSATPKGILLPWENDDAFRIAIFHGHDPIDAHPMAKNCTFTYEGPAKDIYCSLNLCCGDVQGNINADGYVECGSVGGNMNVGGYVECGDIQGSLTAGAYVECGNVGGNLTAGSYAECGNIGGSAIAGGYIESGAIYNQFGKTNEM